MSNSIQKIIIRYHKTINKKGVFPDRLLIPEMNFTKTFSKIRYLGIEIMLDKTKVDYSSFAIVRASKLKERLK